MSSVNGDFMDSKNIVIINDVPHFSFKGDSYLEKLKNGLSLDYVFMMEDSAVHSEEKFEEEEDYKQLQPLKHELFDEDYDCEVMPMPRKGKNIIKTRSDKNMKKNKVKQNGYTDKLDMVEVNLPNIWDPDFDWHEFYSKKNEDDNYSYYEPYDSDTEYYSRMAFWGDGLICYSPEYDSSDDWNNANITGRGWD
jgi:hypothetical protein